MQVTIYQHADYESPGIISDWLDRRAARVRVVDWSQGQQDGLGETTDLLIVMGGPMNVDEFGAYPWLVPERAMLRRHVEAGTPILGICLGAQLLARVLGAPVHRNPEPEIGWFPVELLAEARQDDRLRHWPGRFEPLHWHGDTFELPAGAAPIGHSAACPRQGFLWGDRIVAFQFHPEATPALVEGFVDRNRDTLPAGRPWVQEAAALLAGAAQPAVAELHAALFATLDALADRIAQPPNHTPLDTGGHA